MKSKLCLGLAVEKVNCFYGKQGLNIVKADELNSELGSGIAFRGLAWHFQKFH